MYCYEVFVLKEVATPGILNTFEKTHETRFFKVYSKAVTRGETTELDKQLDFLGHAGEISYFYWSFIPEGRADDTA